MYHVKKGVIAEKKIDQRERQWELGGLNDTSEKHVRTRVGKRRAGKETRGKKGTEGLGLRR